MTFDAELQLRNIDGYGRELVGTSIYELVPQMGRDVIEEVRRRLFELGQLVSCVVPVLYRRRSKPRWWVVRAAPLREYDDIPEAIACATPHDKRTQTTYPLVTSEAWQRELAWQELQPMLSFLTPSCFPGSSSGLGSGTARGDHLRQGFHVRLFDLTEHDRLLGTIEFDEPGDQSAEQHFD